MLSPEIERIVQAGNQAPSGENCQPWRFVVRDQTIEVHMLPERDQSAYSWGQRASYLANGAAIENIVVAASAEHYRTDTHYFPDAGNPSHVATIVLAKDPKIAADPLATFTDARISNRKPYQKGLLTSEERAALVRAVGGEESFSLTEDPSKLQRLGRVGATNEEVMLANQSLHNFFFSHVSWTKGEDEKKKIGFYIKTLELPPPAQVMFKAFRHWPVMRTLSKIGFNRVVAKQNAATNASAAAIGAFMLDRIEPLDFVKVGRAVERVWLTATSLGLSFQPLTGVLFFKLKIMGGEADAFSPQERKLVMDAYQEASHIFKAGERHIAFMFRIGRAEAPSAHAVRFPLTEVVTIV